VLPPLEKITVGEASRRPPGARNSRASSGTGTQPGAPATEASTPSKAPEGLLQDVFEKRPMLRAPGRYWLSRGNVREVSTTPMAASARPRPAMASRPAGEVEIDRDAGPRSTAAMFAGDARRRPMPGAAGRSKLPARQRDAGWRAASSRLPTSGAVRTVSSRPVESAMQRGRPAAPFADLRETSRQPCRPTPAILLSSCRRSGAPSPVRVPPRPPAVRGAGVSRRSLPLPATASGRGGDQRVVRGKKKLQFDAGVLGAVAQPPRRSQVEFLAQAATL